MVKVPKKAKDTKLEENLKYIGLSLTRIPKFLKEFEEISYRFHGSKENEKYRVYRNVPIENIQILITNTERLEEAPKKYAEASPLPDYLDSKSRENAEKHAQFLQMVENIDIAKIEELEKEQQTFKKQQPYLVKYRNNYKWQIFYSERANKYFMLVPAKEQDNSALFYILKKQIELKKAKKKETIYVPISFQEPSKELFSKTQITEIENSLYLLTKEWPDIYEVENIEDQKVRIEIIGTTNVYEQIKSTYKITIRSKKEAVELEHWLRVLFTLKRDLKEDYTFVTNIDKNGKLEMYHHNQKITFDDLPTFIQEQIEYNQEEIEALISEGQEQAIELTRLKNEADEKNEEYLEKQKQIFTFLECRKSFFGKVKYFFKGKGGKKKIRRIPKELQKEENEETETTNEPETSNTYGNSLEDLIQVCKKLNEQRNENKNRQLDINGVKGKIESLERKIKNADLYLKEIESHKKSIIEFFRYTNKDEAKAISEAEKQEENNTAKVKKYFDIETDLYDLGIQMDKLQRQKLSTQECDIVYLASEIGTSINAVCKKRIGKIERAKLEDELEKQKKKIKKQQWEEGGIIKNAKHREQPRKVANILTIDKQTTYDEYKTMLKEKKKLLQEAFHKIQTPYDLSIYKILEKEEELAGYQVFDLNPNTEIPKTNKKKKVLYKVNLKEKEELLFYTNIMYYHNDNKTLPEGMDLSTNVLLNLEKYELIELKETEFNRLDLDQETPTIETIELIECELTKKDPEE